MGRFDPPAAGWKQLGSRPHDNQNTDQTPLPQSGTIRHSQHISRRPQPQSGDRITMFDYQRPPSRRVEMKHSDTVVGFEYQRPPSRRVELN